VLTGGKPEVQLSGNTPNKINRIPLSGFENKKCEDSDKLCDMFLVCMLTKEKKKIQ
jgi:hypothetical protein